MRDYTEAHEITTEEMRKQSVGKPIPKRIALTGRLRTGKSLLALLISRDYGHEVLSFGDSLKAYAQDIFAFSDVYPNDIEREEDEIFGGEIVSDRGKPRKLFQDFGQAMRELDENVWIQHLENSIEVRGEHLGQERFIIDDLRQPNEFEWARANGFLIVRVNANEDERLGRARVLGDEFSEADLRHDTEQHVDDFDVDLDVWNGNETDVERLADEIIEKLGEIV